VTDIPSNSAAGTVVTVVAGNPSLFPESIMKESPNYFSHLALFFVGVGNCILMIFADIFYVLIILNDNSAVVLLAEILLALFKIALNNHILWTSIPFMRDLLDGNKFKENQNDRSTIYSMNPDDENGIPTATKIKLYKYTRNDLLFLSFMILLNNMIFPAIAIIFVSPDCLINALVSEASVSSSYSYQICSRYFFIGSEACVQYLTYSITTSYSPPFIYSYQCSSIIIINYVAVFILMSIFEGIIQPCFKLLVKFLYDGYYEHGAVTNEGAQTIGRAEAGLQVNTTHGNHPDLTISRMSQFIRDHNPSFYDPSRISEKDDGRRQTEAYSISNSFAQRDTVLINRRTRLTVVYKVETVPPWYYRMIFAFLPYTLTPLVPEPSTEIKSALLLFDKNRIIVRITAYFMVIMTFGVLFPPLAFILCFTVISLTLYEEMVIGRILYESEKLNYPWYKKQIDRNCSGISNGLEYSLWTIVPVSCLFLGYIVFDTFGDDNGWKQALPPALVMMAVPILFLAFFTTGKQLYTYWENRYLSKQNFVDGVANSQEFRETDFSGSVNNCANMKPVIELTTFPNSPVSACSNSTKSNHSLEESRAVNDVVNVDTGKVEISQAADSTQDNSH
jgi:hypothetical protein